MKIRHTIVLLTLSIISLGARDCGFGNPLNAESWPTGASSGGMAMGICSSTIWACNAPSSLIDWGHYPGTPACGVLDCDPTVDAAMAHVASLLGGMTSDFPSLVCLYVGKTLADAAKFDANTFVDNCVAPRAAPCKGVGELCDGHDCCEPLLCDPGRNDVEAPAHCCADPDTGGPCKTADDCCFGRCEGGACACYDLGGPCSSLWDCCRGYCGAGVCACLGTGEACDGDALRDPCCDGDYCTGGVCTPG